MRYASLAIVYVNNPFENDCKSTTFIWNNQFFFLTTTVRNCKSVWLSSLAAWQSSMSAQPPRWR